MGCMSFSNYLLTLVVLLFTCIFFATAAIINQALIRLRDQPDSLPGISYKNASAYVTWGIVMGIIAAVIVVLIAIFSFVVNRGRGATGGVKTPAGVIAVLVMGFLIFGVFSALFIGNSIFLAKMKSIIASDPASIAVSPNTVEVFYILNAILAAIATVITVLALIGFILCLFPQTQRFMFALFGVGRPSSATALAGLTGSTTAGSTAAKSSRGKRKTTTSSYDFDEQIEMLAAAAPATTAAVPVVVTPAVSTSSATSTSQTLNQLLDLVDVTRSNSSSMSDPLSIYMFN